MHRLRKQGWTVIEWDVCNGSLYDLTVAANLSRLLRITGSANLVHIATPCSSFSTARRGHPGSPGGPLRSNEHPLGLPQLQGIDRDKVRIGNVFLRATVRIVKTCIRHGVRAVIENPLCSWLWKCPSLAHLVKRAEIVNFDFCRYGTRWLKPTRLAVWNTSCLDPLGKRCGFQTNKHFHCSSTGKRHHRLEGKASNNIPWTQIAQPYPTQLVKEYAELVTDAINNEFRRSSWEAFYARST